jgi:L-methionine (R)-S-oxide reductase
MNVGTKSEQGGYEALDRTLAALLAGERDWIANLANTAALLYAELADLNWAGFYLLKQGELVLGPFQGKPACVRIALGKGVCGTAAAQRRSIVVPDVHEFPGHIACDSASNSELVVPLTRGGELLGVLDLDSPLFERFDDEDRRGLEAIAATVVRASKI